MRRALWAAMLLVSAVGGILLVRGLSRLAQQPQEVGVQEGPQPGAPLRTVRLYFGSAGHVGLAPEERVILDPGNTEDLAEAVAHEVLTGPRHGVMGLSPETRVRAFYLTPDGTGYLDLSSELLVHWPRGDGLEWVSVGSLIRSLTENIPAIRAVQILVEGRVVERAPGAIQLDLPLDPTAFGASEPEAAMQGQGEAR